MQANAAELGVRIWRGNASGGGFVEYRVPVRESQSILDVVTWIQRNREPALGYRFACRVGMCGSCAMTVNGIPRWTCRTHVNRVAANGRLEIAPLANLPVIKDLVTDMGEFFDKWRAAEARFHPTASRNDGIVAVDPQSPERRQADAAIECINCAICYSACDVVARQPGYLGPAALNRAWTLVNDVRDGAGELRLRAVAGPGGCYNCHSQQGCSSWCPKELNPTAAIAGLKRKALKMAFRRGDPDHA